MHATPTLGRYSGGFGRRSMHGVTSQKRCEPLRLRAFFTCVAGGPAAQPVGRRSKELVGNFAPTPPTTSTRRTQARAPTSRQAHYLACAARTRRTRHTPAVDARDAPAVAGGLRQWGHGAPRPTTSSTALKRCVTAENASNSGPNQPLPAAPPPLTARSDRVAGAVVRLETAANGTGSTAYITGDVAEPGGTLLGLLLDHQTSPREVRALHAHWTRTLIAGLFDMNISRPAVARPPARCSHAALGSCTLGCRADAGVGAAKPPPSRRHGAPTAPSRAGPRASERPRRPPTAAARACRAVARVPPRAWVHMACAGSIGCRREGHRCR